MAESGHSYWQVLPLGQTSYGDSPYQSFSAFAGNPYFIDLDMLADEGLLEEGYASEFDWGDSEKYVDYGRLFKSRYIVLDRAFQNFMSKCSSDGELRGRYEEFKKADHSWLDEYSLYMACKEHFGYVSWTEWDDDIRLRRPEAVTKYAQQLADRIEFWNFCQYEFFEQWNRLKCYVNARGIQIIGDIPIYVAPDSADVWANKELFKLDSKGHPLEVAGVPPDYFSATGQLWGNPLYDWDAMKDDGYRWWIERVRNQLDQVDYIRIDHFRGFEAYWAVPAGEKTAMNGKWKKGPGEALFEAIQKALGEELPIFAEDLGIITPEVEKLRDTLGFPGMKILQFGFDGTGESTFLPHQLSTRNCICYTGTHDNDTTCGWYEHTNEQNKDKVRRYMNTDASSVSWDFIRTCLGTIAKYAIFPVQDLLKLGSEHRMNTPGTATGNWEFRYRSGLLDEGMAKGLKQMTELFGRWG